MARIRTTEISGTECIGDSLIRINQNFEALDTATENLTSYVTSLSTAIETVTPTPPILTLVAGNGILIDDGNQSILNNQNVEVAAYDSIVHMPNSLTTLLNQSNTISYVLADGTTPKFTRLPYVTGDTKPGVAFETTSLGSISPSLTLYWLTSTGSVNSTTYATNSGENGASSWYPDIEDKVATNAAVVKCAKFINNRTLLIGGTFTKMGSAFAANAPSYGTLRNRFAAVDLLGGGTSTDGSKFGLLSSIPVTTGTIGERILNTSNGINPGNDKTRGFTAGSVDTIEHFTVASTNKEWYAIGGTFANAEPIATANVENLILINKNNTTTACLEFPLVVTGAVRRLLYADGYLYVAGGMTKVKMPYPGTWGTNAINDDQPVSGLFRIDMTGTTPRLDLDFISQLKTPGEAFLGPAVTINYYDGILYVGGMPAMTTGPKFGTVFSSAGFAAIYTQPTGTGRTPIDRAPGRVVKDWAIAVTATNGIKCMEVDPVEKMLYIGGNPTKFVQRTPYNSTTPVTYTVKNIAAFDITNPANPVLKQNWLPSFIPAANPVISMALDDPGNPDSPLYVYASTNLFYCISNPNAGGNPNATAGNLTSWKQTVDINNAAAILAEDTLIRIPKTSPLSGVLVTGKFKTVNTQKRQNVAIMNGLGEGVSAPLSSVTFNIQGSLISPGDFLDRSTSLITLTANIGAPFTVNRTVTPALTAVFGDTIQRKQLLRFTVTRPGDDGVEIEEGTNIELPRPDTYKNDIWLYGMALDFNK